MSNIDKRALREAAEKATPGDWWIDSHGMAMVAHHNDNTMIVFVTDGEQMGKAIRHEDTGNLSHWRNDNDASFIAAANPATVLALLDELEAAEKRIAELTEKPIGWTDEQELRDVEKLGCGYLFNANPITPHADPSRVILLYAAAAAKGE